MIRLRIFSKCRASISLGYIGIHETINALYKQGHVFDDEQLREKGIAIVRRLSEAVKQWQKETGYAFSFIPHQVKTCAIVSAVRYQTIWRY